MGLSRRIVIAVAVGAASVAVAAAACGVSPGGSPEPIEELETVRTEGAKLQDRSGQLRAGIDEIAANFEAAAGLSDVSGEIKSLTLAQQRSLLRVRGLLRRQVDSIVGTATVVAEIRSLNAELADASARQAATLERNLDDIRRIRRVARRTRAISAYFARQAVYGARLAEDSARSFGW